MHVQTSCVSIPRAWVVVQPVSCRILRIGRKVWAFDLVPNACQFRLQNELGTQLESCESFGQRPHVIDRSPERVQGGCPHPGAEWVSSPRSRGVGVLTLLPRECPHSRAERVSSPLDFLDVLTRVPPVGLLSKSCQDNLAARAEVAVVLHQPLRDPGMTFPGRRTSEPCWSVSRRWLPSASQCWSTTVHPRTCWLVPWSVASVCSLSGRRRILVDQYWFLRLPGVFL